MCCQGVVARSGGPSACAFGTPAIPGVVGGTCLGYSLYLGRQYDKAIGQLRKTMELHPDDWLTLTNLACAIEQKGQLTESLQLLQKLAPTRERNPWLLAVTGRGAPDSASMLVTAIVCNVWR